MNFLKKLTITTLLAVFFIQLAWTLHKTSADIWGPVQESRDSVPANVLSAPSVEGAENSDYEALPEIKNSKYSYFLEVPKLDLNGPVVGMGIDEEEKMAVPDNYFEIGWYNLGAKPGEEGNAVFGAHVDNGGNVSGPFKRLNQLNIGDDIYVKGHNGRTLHYKVSEREIYDYDETDTEEVFLGEGSSKIKLITCEGTFMPFEDTYDKRLVVTAELVK